MKLTGMALRSLCWCLSISMIPSASARLSGSVSRVANLSAPTASGVKLPENPPVNASNAYDRQEAHLYQFPNCCGAEAMFTSAANAFIPAFKPYVGNTSSVMFCGKGVFFYYADTHMDYLLGHMARCGENFTKNLTHCTCMNVPHEQVTMVQSFTIQYC
mmetsp:Transcript_45838/g.106546  ORF Transcript_45838/g.106546 Transcript_45838/m.106546 type:complete len:159 (+) Transcript_45838:52-528(+)